MRRELGRQLAMRRTAAGLVQRELGRLVGYSRSAIANAETGATVACRRLWQGADAALGTGELFTRGHDRVQARICAEAQARAEMLVSALDPGGQLGDGGLATVTASRALQAYRDRGWLVDRDAGGRLWLVTGTVIDALEVPQLAGLVAVGWWLYTRGVPDPIRGLPALPDPAGAAGGDQHRYPLLLPGPLRRVPVDQPQHRDGQKSGRGRAPLARPRRTRARAAVAAPRRGAGPLGARPLARRPAGLPDGLTAPISPGHRHHRRRHRADPAQRDPRHARQFPMITGGWPGWPGWPGWSDGDERVHELPARPRPRVPVPPGAERLHQD
jgi:transcriptional regulator with XRE-family HTH domain